MAVGVGIDNSGYLRRDRLPGYGKALSGRQSYAGQTEAQTPYICGERCRQLRCEYLHQNKGFLNDEDESRIRFYLGVNCGTSVCEKEQLWRKNKATPVIILSDSEGSGCLDDGDSKMIRLEMPVTPKVLRETVIALVK